MSAAYEAVNDCCLSTPAANQTTYGRYTPSTVPTNTGESSHSDSYITAPELEDARVNKLERMSNGFLSTKEDKLLCEVTENYLAEVSFTQSPRLPRWASIFRINTSR